MPSNLDHCPSLRWYTGQLYVYDTKSKVDPYITNKSGGSTVSVKKRGGWDDSWSDARKLAGWNVQDVN